MKPRLLDPEIIEDTAKKVNEAMQETQVKLIINNRPADPQENPR